MASNIRLNRILPLFTLFVSAYIPSALQAKPKICVVVPLSGQYSALGQRVMRAVKFQAQRDRACDLDVQGFDTKGLGDNATIALSNATNDPDCLVIIGGIGDQTGSNMATWSEASGIPCLLLNGKGPLQKPVWTMRLRPTREALFTDLGTQVAGMGLLSGFVACGADNFQDEACTSFAKGVTSAGGNVIGRLDCTDPKSCAAKLAATIGKKSHVHYFVFAPFKLYKMVRFYAYLSYMQIKSRVVVVGGPMLDVPALLLSRAADLEGLIFGDVFSAVLNPELVAQYRRFTGHDLSTLEVWAMDSTEFVCQAYTQGAQTKAAIRSYMEQTSAFQGMGGEYLNPDHTQWRSTIRLFKVTHDTIQPM